MARLPYVDPAQAPPAVREALEALPPLNVFRTLAHAETALRPALRLGQSILTRQELDATLRELAILVVARRTGATYEWVQHVAIGRAVGVRDEQIAALERGEQEAVCFDERERLVMRATDELVEGAGTSEPTFAALKEAFTDREIVELVLTAGYYRMLATLMNSAAIDLDEPVGTAVMESAPQQAGHRLNVRRAALAAALGLALLAAPSQAATRLGGCSVFPASNAWNRDVSKLTVDSRSSAYIGSISAQGNRFLHADFGGGGQYGIPYRVVARSQPRVPIRFTDYGDESDPGPYPVPLNAPVEGGSDRHVLTLQSGTCRLFELYNARRSGSGWAASSGAVFNLRSNRLRHETWTSADAAGLPILAGLARYDEVKRGVITHALRFTVPRSQRGYIHPATHQAGDSSSADLPPMGLRLRLKKDYSLRRFHGQSLVILRALRRYGMIVADNGSGWFITGAADRRWNDEDLNQLKTVPASAFEAVKTGRIRR